MCVIIHKQRGHNAIPDQKLVNAISSNPHGIGWFQYDHDTGEYFSGKKFFREGPKKLENIKKQAKIILGAKKSVETFLHLRFTTAGKTNKQNVHPFVITTPEEGKGIWFMHNGTIGVKHDDDNASDSKTFAEHILRPIFLDALQKDKKVNPFDIKHIDDLIETVRTAQSRFVFVTEHGEYKKYGTWSDLEFGHCSNNTYFNTARYSKSNYNEEEFDYWGRRHPGYNYPVTRPLESNKIRTAREWFTDITTARSIPRAEIYKKEQHTSTPQDPFWKKITHKTTGTVPVTSNGNMLH